MFLVTAAMKVSTTYNILFSIGDLLKFSGFISFKLMVVELYRNGKAASTIAKNLGIGVDMVRWYAKEHNDVGSRSFPGNGNHDQAPEQQEILELKRALQQL